MYCSNCGKEIQKEIKYCSQCGTENLSFHSVEPEKKEKKPLKKQTIKRLSFLAVLVVVGLAVFLIVDKSNSLSGTYESLVGNTTFVLKEEGEDKGTFEVYVDGESPEKENLRYTKTWEKDGDVLILEYDDDTTYYFLVVDGGLIELEDEDEEPRHSDLIAPEGDTFDYEIDGKKFFVSGDYESEYIIGGRMTYNGKYYRENDVIYHTLIGSEEYFPQYWIYNGDYITDAQDVYLKK